MRQISKKTVPYVVRRFRDIDLVSLYRMIQRTIDVSYPAVYPHRAVQFFKEYHSEKRIMERSQAGEILVIEQNGSIVATGALVGKEKEGTLSSTFSFSYCLYPLNRYGHPCCLYPTCRVITAKGIIL